MRIDKLDLKDRLLLRNQCVILARLDPKESHYWARMAEVLERGYEAEYSNLTFLFSETFSREQSHFVGDVLDMFRAIERAKDAGVEPAEGDDLNLKFWGFDGNNEGTYLAYAEFVVKPEGQWDSFKGKIVNSHMQVLGKYREMVESWKQSADQQELTREDLRRIASSISGGR